ncbi:MAG: hypothetical protein DI536_18995 [Archangium gephyra]|uniref:Uncharacterized protein n=1 Tax=Archangium gephyra TaxID=48 RepID=A0A2W5THB0_9BACT|nr:MAG: hypothetical protein DI536_18995 [Archangium gephyra]
MNRLLPAAAFAVAEAPTAEFAQVRGRIDANHRSRSTPGMGGALEFQVRSDFAAREDAKLKRRWPQTGAGCTHARVDGGDLAIDSEGWDAPFASRSFVNSGNPAETSGAPSTCAFTAAEYPAL